MGEKLKICIIPHINQQNNVDNIDVESDFDLQSTIRLLYQAIIESQNPKNVETLDGKVIPFIQEKLKVSIVPNSNNSNDIELLSDFKLEPTVYLINEAIKLLIEPQNIEFLCRKPS